MKPSLYSIAEKRDFARQMRLDPTRAESDLWFHLRGKKLGYRFHRQSVQWGYIIDFYCPKLRLGIEVDGSVHSLEDVAGDDEQRERVLEGYGIELLRFANEDVLGYISVVLLRIREECECRRIALKAVATGTRDGGINVDSRSSRPCVSLQNSANRNPQSNLNNHTPSESQTPPWWKGLEIPPPEKRPTAEDWRLINKKFAELVVISRQRSLAFHSNLTTALEQKLRLEEYMRKKHPASELCRDEVQSLALAGMHVTERKA